VIRDPVVEVGAEQLRENALGGLLRTLGVAFFLGTSWSKQWIELENTKSRLSFEKPGLTCRQTPDFGAYLLVAGARFELATFGL
jgi:hypothetical protein